jgi:hypothetical protein
MDTVLRQDLIDVALRATDAYLGVEKHATKNGFATQQDIHDFSFYLSKAHDALTQLGDIENHQDYMANHVKTMMKLANHDDSTLADMPYVHVPKSDTGDIEESVQIDETIRKMGNKYRILSKQGKNLGTFDTLAAAKKHKREVEYFKHMGEETKQIDEISAELKNRYKTAAKDQVRVLEPFAKKGEYKDLAKNLINRRTKGIEKANEEVEQIDEEASKGLAAKAAKSGISLGTLKKVYSRGVAAWRTGHRPGTTPQQWGMARVNSYITKGKTYHTADKDLHEAAAKKKSSDDHLEDEELNNMVKSLKWDDIADTYQNEELVVEQLEEDVLDEKLTAAARLKKQRDFRRSGVKRNIARGLRLQRVSSPDRLKKRAIVAARRLLSRKFLRGRDKSELSPQEKDLLEQRLKRMQELGIQATLATRLMPKIRSIEQKRLKHK